MAIDWTRAAVIGALVGAVFWAAAVFTLIVSDGATAAWVVVGVVAAALVAVGVPLYRRAAQPQWRCYGAGFVLAPFTGVVPMAVFSTAGLIAHVGASI